MKCILCGNDHEDKGDKCQFKAATSGELFRELGMSQPEVEKAERGLNAILRRGEMKIINNSEDS